jgi:hypothetical protein
MVKKIFVLRYMYINTKYAYIKTKWLFILYKEYIMQFYIVVTIDLKYDFSIHFKACASTLFFKQNLFE